MTEKEFKELEKKNTILSDRVTRLESIIEHSMKSQKRNDERLSRVEKVQNQFKTVLTNLEKRFNSLVSTINNRRYRP